MKTVLILVPCLGIGGQERIAINTANCLKNDYNVKLVIFQKSDIEYDSPCEVIDLNLPARNNVFGKIWNQIHRIFRLARIRRQTKADVVLSLGTSANLTNVFSSMISSGKCISSIHGFAEVKKNLLMNCIMKFSDKVICIAQAMREGLMSIYPKAKNVCVIENGYDVETIFQKSKESTQDRLPTPYIVSMGRLEHVKGFDRLIKAFAVVRKTRTNLNLLLIGDGSLALELQELAKAEGVSDFVHFCGYKSNPYAYLRQAEMYVLSSRNEGFPNCLIEALCSELPVVSMDCMSGPREILSHAYSSTRVIGIQNEKYGILVEEADAEEKNIENLSCAILQALSQEAILATLKQQAYARARTFGNEVYAKKIISLIENVSTDTRRKN